MLIDEKDKERRINSEKNLLNLLPRKSCAVNRPVRDVRGKAIPKPLKIIAGALAHAEPAKIVAGALELKASTVYKSKAEDGVSETTARIRDVALDRLMKSLGVISDEKLEDTSAKDASLVARNLAVVAEKLSPKEKSETEESVKLVIYSPRQKNEDNFEVIDVRSIG